MTLRTPSPPAVEACTRVLRVLLVDDDPDQALIVRRRLARIDSAHFEVSYVDRLAKIPAAVSTSTPDVVLLDLSLPEGRGLKVFEWTQTLLPGAPVVVLTGLHDPKLGADAIRAGAEDFLDKDELTGPSLARALWLAVESRRR